MSGNFRAPRMVQNLFITPKQTSSRKCKDFRLCMYFAPGLRLLYLSNALLQHHGALNELRTTPRRSLPKLDTRTSRHIDAAMGAGGGVMWYVL